MTADSFRFRPPDRPLPPAADWVLAAAFGPSSRERPTEPAAVLNLARQLALSARIRHRTGDTALVRDLGREIAAVFAGDHHRAVAGALRVQEAARQVSKIAHDLEILTVPLKGAALFECGAVELGSRFVSDLDLLVAAEAADRLVQALRPLGFAPGSLAETHHLPPLVHPGLGIVELHTYVPHLDAGGGERLDIERVVARALLRAGTSPSAGWWRLPKTELLAAHAIAHGLDQHAFTPALGPVLRTVGDLLDLAPQGGGLEPLIERAAPLIGGVSERERRALIELCSALGAGHPASAGDAERLLRHAVAAASDARYRRALKRQAIGAALRRRDWGRFHRRLRQRWRLWRDI